MTIFGESAGSFAVSALVASPLAKGLFHKAIGESGAFFSGGDARRRGRSRRREEQGVKFGATVGADSLAALRAKPAAELLAASSKMQPGFAPNLDGYFLRRGGAGDLCRRAAEPACRCSPAGTPTRSGGGDDASRRNRRRRAFAADVRKRFGDSADAILKVYPASTDEEALESAAAMGSDLFIGYSTWKWIEMHAADRAVAGLPLLVRPEDPGRARRTAKASVEADIGARHAGEIEYVFGTLDLSLPKVPWEPGTASSRKR